MKNITKNYIAGEYSSPEDPVAVKKHFSPANSNVLLETWKFGFKDIDKALTAALHAQKTWGSLSTDKRSETLNRVLEFIQTKEKEWTSLLCDHSGMCEADAADEMNRALLAAKQQLNQTGMKALDERFNGQWSYNPLGTAALIGSYSESFVYGLQESFRYLISGNTVVFKPSEKLFISGSLLSQAFHSAELPLGAWNMIYGDREVGRRLAVHESIDSVSFFGGYESAIRIKQDILQQNWKRMSLWMCGKSVAIVDESSPVDLAVEAVLSGAFSNAGQCCDSTSRVFLHNKIKDSFIEKLHQESKQIRVGGMETKNAQMGALIDEGAMDRYIKFQGIASREGAEIIMRGKALDMEAKGYFVSPSIAIVKDNDFEKNRRSVYLQTEILGPNVAIQSYDDLDEAVVLANNNQFPIACSVFTASEMQFLKTAELLKYSRVIFNQSTRTPAFQYPQTAIKKSGNQSLGGALGFLETGNIRALIK
ncbi:MAG: aldehyde dehydrogenase family protein [Xanthomonadaceae bacterium]|nr:aldehyde dehydrogenase family protein [Xanthomonadaceae bacterium]